MSKYFKELNYTLGDEDANYEMSVLPLCMNHILAVSDCGSRIIPLLAKRPQKLTCVDISPLQLAVTKLRVALLEECNLEDFKMFLGYEPGMSPATRKSIFKILKIDYESKNELNNFFENIKWAAPLYYGRFERTLKILSIIISVIVGRKIREIFKFDSLDLQNEFYKNKFPHFRWKIALFLLGNSTALNSILYKGEFPKNNTGISYFKIYKKIFENLFTANLAKNSFFLQILILGKIKFIEGFPIECNSQIYEMAKSAKKECDIFYSESDVFDEIKKHVDLNFISLSDVPSFLDDKIAGESLQILKPHIEKGALVVIRGHVRIIRPNTDGFLDVSNKYLSFAERESTQLWSIGTYSYI